MKFSVIVACMTLLLALPVLSRTSCGQSTFCMRQKKLRKAQQDAFASSEEAYLYMTNKHSLEVSDEESTISLNLVYDTSLAGFDFYAPCLHITMTFYQNGIMRLLVDEPESGRFKISEQELPVVEDQLHGVQNLSDYVSVTDDLVQVSGLKHQDGEETFTYKIYLNGLSIEQYSGDELTLVLNPIDSLYMEQA
jgi:hypothetical protein